jgi:hypothetical protein
MILRLLVVALAAGALAGPAAAASPQYSFGREGGNILPFTVTISQSGAVHVTGPVRAGRASLTAAQSATLGAAIAAAHLSTLPATTLCPGTLPDIAATWIAVGRREVRVHGSCSPRFTRAWTALASAVRLSN